MDIHHTGLINLRQDLYESFGSFRRPTRRRRHRVYFWTARRRKPGLSGIKLIVTRHEQAAAFMATTYGRLTGKPGICLSLGPGATNLVTGVAQAPLIGVPFLSPVRRAE
jgi:hypothetical protein